MPPASLPDDLSICHRMIQELLASLREMRHDNEGLRHRLDLLLRRVYGQRAEKWDPNQPLLFPEMNQESAVSPEAPPAPPVADSNEPNSDTEGSRSGRKGHGRRALPDNLPRERREYALNESECLCPACQTPRRKIGEQTSEQLDYRPACLFVIEHVRHTYACPECDGQLTTAAKPEQPIAKGLPGSGLLAQVIVSKYLDHLPLHRLERIFARSGLKLSRSTTCDWVGKTAELVRPLYELMIGEVLASRVVQTDDTTLRVLDPKGGPARTGRLWVACGDALHPYVVYDFTLTREGDGPARFFGNYQGYLQADAYAGYDQLFAKGTILEVGCWAHARRKFYENRNALPALAHEALARIRQLYVVEAEIKERIKKEKLTRAQAEALFKAERGEKSLPLVTSICQWLADQREQVLPKNPLREAIDYTLNLRAALTRYTSEGFLHIDNNAAEQQMRPVALGRKNWLFTGSAKGGETAAIWFSLLASATRAGVEPFVWIKDVLTRLAAGPPNPAQLRDLLPDRRTPPTIPNPTTSR